MRVVEGGGHGEPWEVLRTVGAREPGGGGHHKLPPTLRPWLRLFAEEAAVGLP